MSFGYQNVVGRCSMGSFARILEWYSMNWRGCAAEGKQSARRTPAARSCPHVDNNTAKVFCGPSGEVHDGKKCHTNSAELPWTKEELCGDEFLGNSFRIKDFHCINNLACRKKMVSCYDPQYVKLAYVIMNVDFYQKDLRSLRRCWLFVPA